MKPALLLFACTLAACSQNPIALRDMGSFHVGGREVTISGKPVKEVLFTPANRRGAVPLLLWHGGGLTGVSYESTPDGREGWLNWFVRQGWDVYNSDAVERGRAGWAMFPEIFKTEPLFLPKGDPYERFRIGGGAGTWNADPAKRKLLPGNQFPVEGTTTSCARWCRAGPAPTRRRSPPTPRWSTRSAPA